MEESVINLARDDVVRFLQDDGNATTSMFGEGANGKDGKVLRATFSVYGSFLLVSLLDPSKCETG